MYDKFVFKNIIPTLFFMSMKKSINNLNKVFLSNNASVGFIKIMNIKYLIFYIEKEINYLMHIIKHIVDYNNYSK